MWLAELGIKLLIISMILFIASVILIIGANNPDAVMEFIRMALELN